MEQRRAELADMLSSQSGLWRMAINDDISGRTPEDVQAIVNSLLLAVGGEVQFLEVSIEEDKPFTVVAFGAVAVARLAGEFYPAGGGSVMSPEVHPRNALERIRIDKAAWALGAPATRATFLYRGGLSVTLGEDRIRAGGEHGNGARLADYYPTLLADLAM